jgi:uncharacterized protein
LSAIGIQLWAALLSLVLMAASVVAPARANGPETLEIVAAGGTRVIQIEIAKDDATRERGLMYRRFMPADQGMLFEFDREAPQSFWMKNTYIPLDMIFISRSGMVTNIVADTEPLSERVIPSGPACAAVLELNGGAAAAMGLRVGDKVRHPFFKP